jgi:Predicted transcriptional regulators
MSTFNRSVPVYLQVIELFYIWIVSGQLNPGDQIPPVRKLAVDWGVNPNTVQKSLQQLELDGVSVGQVGRGRFVTTDSEKLNEIKNYVLQKEIDTFLDKMKKYNIDNQAVIEYLQTRMKDGDYYA